MVLGTETPVLTHFVLADYISRIMILALVKRLLNRIIKFFLSVSIKIQGNFSKLLSLLRILFERVTG